MADVQELSDGDMAVVERMKNLSDDVLFGDGEVIDTKAGQAREDDDVRAPDELNELQDGEVSEENDVEAKTGEEGDSDGGLDPETEIEIADPDGGEPQRHKIADLLAAQTELTAFKEQKDQIFEKATTEAREQTQGMVQQVQGWAQNAHAYMQSALQLIQPPPPPDMQMLNPQSQTYDPERYMLMKAQHENVMGQFNQMRQHAQTFLQTQQQLAERQKTEAEEREIAKLTKVWPEFKDDQARNGFVSAMAKHYGYSFDELDASMTDHRNALVARDAIKWREQEAKQMQAKVTLKEKVVAAKPAKAGASQASGRALTSEQSGYMNARKALKSNPKDMHAAAKGFMRFL